jgi:signal transduction histidine kinase/ActR/RegA family two-component response regulator
VVGKDLTMLMPAPVRPRHHAGLARYLATGSRSIPWKGVALPGLHRDGREIPLEISFGEMSVGGRRLFTGIIRDMTEKRALEEQYRQSQKMEALGQLAGGIAHDFNNLLTAIHGYSTMVMETLAPDSTARDDVSEILNATKRAESLTRQLLAFSRRQIIAPRIIDLAAAIRQIEPMLRRLIGEHIELVVKAPALPPQLVRADPGQIEQVVINLAVNARDAMQSGGVLHISVGREPPSRAVMTVRDTGSGMTAETRERLFEPFYTTKAVGKGTGLGLATVHGIVRQSGGSIEVESEPGAGTTFRIVLPRFVGSPDSGSSVRAIAQRSRSETILVAEDDSALRQLVNRVLGKQGYRVLLAGTPTEALAVEASHPDRIHLLLTDVVMPGMNGRALATEILGRRQDIRVVYMSGYTDDEAIKRDVLERGARFIQKPFDPEALRQMVAEALDDPRD